MDGHHGRHSKLPRILDVLQEVARAEADGLQVLLLGLLGVQASMRLQRPDGGHDDHPVGLQSAGPALDVEELLHPHVGPKSGGRTRWRGQLPTQMEPSRPTWPNPPVFGPR